MISVWWWFNQFVQAATAYCTSQVLSFFEVGFMEKVVTYLECDW